MGEMIQKFKYDALKEAHDELKEKYDALKDKYEGLVFDFQELKAKRQSASESCECICNDCRKLREENCRLARGMDKFISENVKLKEDYNKLVDENKALTETLDKLRTKPDHEEAKKFFESLQQEPIKLSPVLSEVPNMVINTKNLYLTFDNHTNNFKEDDTND